MSLWIDNFLQTISIMTSFCEAYICQVNELPSTYLQIPPPTSMHGRKCDSIVMIWVVFFAEIFYWKFAENLS